MDKSRTRTAGKHTRHLTKPLLMEDEVRPRVFIRLMVMSGIFIAAFITWASMARMKELTIVTGRVEIAGALPVIHNPNTGRVVKILARQGQIVEEGAPLVHLRSAIAIRSLQKLQIRQADLLLQKERLLAALHERLPRFGAVAVKYPALARQQRAISSQTRLSNAKLRASLANQVKNRDVKVDEFTRQVTDVTRLVEMQSRQLKTRRILFKRGVVSRENFWQARRIYEKTHGELLNLRVWLKHGLEALNDARTALLDFHAAIKKKRMDASVEITGRLGEVKHQIALLEQFSEKSFIRAPVSGVVLELISEKPGEMIDAGRLIAKIMPLNQKLTTGIRLEQDQINHLDIGQKVQVGITAFDATYLGVVEGVVKQISVTKPQNDTGGTSSKAIIVLSRNYIIRSARHHMIRPGMMARLKLVSRARSFAAYVVDPVYKSAILLLSHH